MRISGSMSLDVVRVGMTTTSASFSHSDSASWSAPGVSTTATCAPVRLVGAVQGAALGVQVVEAHGDAGALEGECYLVGDQDLPTPPFWLHTRIVFISLTSLYI